MTYMSVSEMIHRLRLGEQISFRRFMDTSLYSLDGYYNRYVKIGGDGADFYTASQSPLFAYTMANAVVSAWHRLNSPGEFQVVELGAGQGELALLIARRLKALLPDIHLKYVIMEKSEMLANLQKKKILSEAANMEKDTFLEMWTWGMPSSEIDSVVIGNEVLDAFAVERLRKSGPSFKRSFIVMEQDGNTCKEIWKTAPRWLCDAAKTYLPIPNGHISEMCLSYPSFAKKCALYGRNVEFIFIDYGISKEELTSGIRPDGTARGYQKHQVCSPLMRPGHIDITSDVVWHIAEKAFENAGFADISLIKQGEFLLAHGALSVLSELNAKMGKDILSIMKLNGEMKQLVMPGGFGERFQVLTGHKIG